jgi:hypothetical protein
MPHREGFRCSRTSRGAGVGASNHGGRLARGPRPGGQRGDRRLHARRSSAWPCRCRKAGRCSCGRSPWSDQGRTPTDRGRARMRNTSILSPFGFGSVKPFFRGGKNVTGIGVSDRLRFHDRSATPHAPPPVLPPAAWSALSTSAGGPAVGWSQCGCQESLPGVGIGVSIALTAFDRLVPVFERLS